MVYWQEHDVYDILSSYKGRIYNSLNLETRRVVLAEDLNKLELVDDEDHEIPIYTKDGYKLLHCLATFNKNASSHGVLVDLHNLRALFPTNNEYDDLFDKEVQFLTMKYYVYPQARLVTMGHFQADTMMLRKAS